jgi:hypothetical protein
MKGARLVQAGLVNSGCSNVILREADLTEALLMDTDLRDADVQGARLRGAYLIGANLKAASFDEADLHGANLRGADLTDAKISRADLSLVTLVDAKLEGAELCDDRIYGLSAWNVQGQPSLQKQLVITRPEEPQVTVDDIEVAQFIYLLLNNQKIRGVINTIGRKAVLVLGRFSPPESKGVLEALARELRQKGLLPILFDFEKSQERDFTETIKVLAGLSLFVIADITNPKSSPLELQATVPDYKIPFVAILQEGEEPFSMFKDLTLYDWVLKPVITYSTIEKVLASLDKAVIKRALKKRAELIAKKAEKLATRPIEEIGEDDE